MTIEEIEKKLFQTNRLKQPVSNGHNIDLEKGYYSIWICDNKKLPPPFSDELKKRNTNLLYIGIAEVTLNQRLWRQELQHKTAATFFRSIGAVLNYRPQAGSLAARKRKVNYFFSSEHTQEIIQWIDKNIEVSFHATGDADVTLEKFLIEKYTPLFNWQHNPKKYLPLKKVKDECRLIARHP